MQRHYRSINIQRGSVESFRFPLQLIVNNSQEPFVPATMFSCPLENFSFARRRCNMRPLEENEMKKWKYCTQDLDNCNNRSKNRKLPHTNAGMPLGLAVLQENCACARDSRLRNYQGKCFQAYDFQAVLRTRCSLAFERTYCADCINVEIGSVLARAWLSAVIADRRKSEVQNA